MVFLFDYMRLFIKRRVGKTHSKAQWLALIKLSGGVVQESVTGTISIVANGCKHTLVFRGDDQMTLMLVN